MKIKLLLLFFLFSLNELIAQKFVFGGTVNYAHSKISFTSRNQDNFFQGFYPSFNTGVFLESKINEKHALGFEALFVQMEDVKEYKLFNRTSEIGIQGSHVQLSYFGLPFYYKYQLGKFGFKIGIQTMIYLRGSSFTYVHAGDNINNTYKGKLKNLRKIDVGLKYGIDYKLLEKLILRLDYYHGQTNIFSIPNFYPRKNRHASLGINFILGTNKT